MLKTTISHPLAASSIRDNMLSEEQCIAISIATTRQLYGLREREIIQFGRVVYLIDPTYSMGLVEDVREATEADKTAFKIIQQFEDYLAVKRKAQFEYEQEVAAAIKDIKLESPSFTPEIF